MGKGSDRNADRNSALTASDVSLAFQTVSRAFPVFIESLEMLCLFLRMSLSRNRFAFSGDML